MRLKFKILEEQFIPLTPLEKLQIIGGNSGPLADADLQRMFNYDSIGGFDSALAKIFNIEIRLLNETETGNGVVDQILAKIVENPINQIKLTQNNASTTTGSKAYYNYNSGNQESSIDIYQLLGADLSNPFEAGIVFQAVSHEFFHAYKSIVKGVHTDNNVTRKLDANLFAAFVEKQTDQLHGTEYYYTGAYQFVKEDPDTTTNTQKAFQLAWDNIITYNDFSLANYNTLIQNFQLSLFNKGGAYDILTCNTIPTFLNNDIAIFNIFYAYYGRYNNTGVGSTGIPGGGGGESPSGVYNIYDPAWGGSSGGYDPGYSYNGGNTGGTTTPQAPAGNGQTYYNGPGGGQTGYGGENYPPGYFESHDSSSY